MIQAATQAVRMAGPKLAAFLGSPAAVEFGKEAGKQALIGTATGTGLEQILPRVMGRQAPPLQESLIRSGVASALNAPVSVGLTRTGLPTFASELMSSAITTGPAAMLSSRLIDPEPHQNPQASYADLTNVQQAEALSERERYDKQIALAYARNYTSPSHVYHHTISAAPAAELAGRVASQMGQVHRYM